MTQLFEVESSSWPKCEEDRRLSFGVRGLLRLCKDGIGLPVKLPDRPLLLILYHWDICLRSSLRADVYDSNLTSGKLHKDYTVYEDVKSILPIYIHVYPVRPCRDDLCEIIPSL